MCLPAKTLVEISSPGIYVCECPCVYTCMYMYIDYIGAFASVNTNLCVQSSQGSRAATQVLQLKVEFHKVPSAQQDALHLCLWERQEVCCW